MANKTERPLLWLSKYLSLALTLPGCVAAGYAMGAAFDRWLHRPVLVAVGILLGLASGVWQVIRELLRDERRNR